MAANMGDADGLQTLLAAQDATPSSASQSASVDDINSVLATLIISAVPMLRHVDVNSLNDEGQTALWPAVQSGKVECVKTLITAGVHVNTKDKFGDTALMRAAIQCHAECIKALIAAGADVNVVDKYGCTPLMFATIGSDDYSPGVLAAGSVASFNSQSMMDREALQAEEAAARLAKQTTPGKSNAECIAILKAAGAKVIPPPAKIADDIVVYENY